jgi:AcrR family transcriptional regulator
VGEPSASTEPHERSELDAIRRRILTSAVQLIDERGSTEITLEDVAGHAGLNPHAAWVFFRNQDDLVVQAALDLLQVEVFSHFAHAASSYAVPTASAYAFHFARHARFYRAAALGSARQAVQEALAEQLAHFAELDVLAVFAQNHGTRDVSSRIVDEAGEKVRQWLTSGSDDPTELFLELEATFISTVKRAGWTN